MRCPLCVTKVNTVEAHVFLVFGGATSLGAHWRDEVGVTAVTVQEDVHAVNLGPHCVG